MKRKAEDELEEGKNRSEKSVLTKERPVFHYCMHCNKYGADVWQKVLWIQLFNPQNGEDRDLVPQWQYLCHQCYLKVTYPAQRVPWQGYAQ